MTIKCIKLLFLLLPFSWWANLHAQEIPDPNRSLRALGMGNAFTAISAGVDSLHYNPAGLARVKGFQWKIIQLGVGASGFEVADDIGQLQGSSGFADALRALYGKSVWAGVNAETGIAMPYFGASFYDHGEAGIRIDNPVYPDFDINFTNDLGITAGFALPLIPPVVDLGLVVKRVQRTGSRLPVGASFISSLDPAEIQSNLENKGLGYALDLGANVFLPAVGDLVLSFVWRNIGNTKFEPDSADLTAPPSDESEMIVGLGLTFDAPLFSVAPAFDFRHLNRGDVQIGKKIHFGVELGFPLIDVRAGFHQGYYTLGAGVNLGVMQVNAATWGVELGAYPGQIEDRRYMVDATFEIDFGGILSFLDFGESSTGNVGRSQRRRLKQRR